MQRPSLYGVFAMVVLLLCWMHGSASAARPQPPFNQCPAIGADASCGVLVIIDKKGRVTGYYDPNEGPYDGGDDTLVGILNDSLNPVRKLPLSGPDIFGFDGDGLCTYVVCKWPNPTGYEGPRNTFTVTDANDGFVNFPGGLAAGASTYFSLEGPTPFQPWVVVHPSNLDQSDVAPNQDHSGLDFGNVQRGLSQMHTLTITNGGNTPLQIQNAQIINSSLFEIVPGPGTTCVDPSGKIVSVDPDDSCAIEVAFSSSGSAEQTGELQLTDNAPDSPQYSSLRATSTLHNLLEGQVGAEEIPSPGPRALPTPNACAGHTVGGPFTSTVGWGLLSHGPVTLQGQVIEAHVATEDATHVPVLGPDFLHFAADYNFFIYPDHGFRSLLKPGNFLVNAEYTPSEVGRIEVEWERFSNTHNGIPPWAWPAVGDKVKVVGWHIVDCGHGSPDFRSEIHPPLFVATYRNAALSPIARWNGRLGSYDASNNHEATLVDVFASSYGGGAFGIEFGHPGQTEQPANLYTYGFTVMAPPKPSATATLAPPSIQRIQGATAPNPLTYATTPDGRGYRFAIHFPHSTRPLFPQVYGSRIRVTWIDKNAPTIPNLHEITVQPLSLHVIENHATIGKADWGLYAYVNEVGRGSLLSGGGVNSNGETYREVSDGDVIDLSHVPPFIVHVVDNQALHISFRGTYFNASRYGCTGCGGGDPLGNASQFYDPSLLSAQQTITLRANADLAGFLGRDEWSTDCTCFDITFRITKR